MLPDAPLVHPELGDIKSNIAFHVDYVRGEPERWFGDADLVVEGRFVTQTVHQGYMEPQACIARFDSSGSLTFWGSLQSPFRARALIAKALGLSEQSIRMIQPYVGGGFGGKGGAVQPLYPICAILAKKSGKPVKIVNGRDEDLIAGRPSLPEIINLRLGLKKSGEIIAKDVIIIADGGAYAGNAPAVLTTSAVRTGSLYRIQNIRMAANLVYTNKVAKGSYRGFGNPQMHFAMESLLDEAAERLTIDPKDIRLMNATRKGDRTVHGWVIDSCGLSESITKAAEKSDWSKKRTTNRKNHGIGMASFIHVSSNRGSFPLFDGSSAIISMNEYGKVKIITGEGDVGQGASTVFAQITAEELGIPVEDIRVLPVDTEISPFGLGAFGSRLTTVGGIAVKMAAVNLRGELLRVASDRLGANAEDLVIRKGRICVQGSPDEGISLCDFVHKEVIKRGGKPFIGIGDYSVPAGVVMPDQKTRYGNISIAYPFGTQIAEVEIDEETGKVDVLGVWAAHDLGRAINPMAAEGQIEGGIVQGMGYGLTESYTWQAGKVVNTTLGDYKMPTALDVPPIEISLIESIDPHGPYGAKGVGETSTVATSPALANAIFNASGIRIYDLPITSEKILEALKARQKKE